VTPAWKRRLAFTRAGRWYTGLTIGIGLAATNTGNNLLFLVLGLLLASIIVSGILSEQSLKSVRVERRLPVAATAGQPALVGLVAQNGKARAPSFSLEIRERGGDAKGHGFLVLLPARKSAEVAYRFVPQRRGLHRFERSRDVGAVGVVLRVGDLAARRDQHGQRDPDAEAGDDRQQRRPPQAGHARADRERDQQAEQQRGGDDQRDQLAQVVRERIAGLGPDLVHVERLALGQLLGDGAVDRLQVDLDPQRRPDRLKACAPVHQRDVDIQRARVPRVDRHPDLADGEPVGVMKADEREVAAQQRGGEDQDEREQPSEVQERAGLDLEPRYSRNAFVSLQKARSCHGISIGANARTSSASSVIEGVPCAAAA